MDITPRVAANRITLDSYGDGGFSARGQKTLGHVLLFPDRMEPWPLVDIQDIGLDDLQPLLALGGQIDIVLIGCGATMRFMTKDVRQAFERAGIGLDAMDTGAACRTFNVLATEDRRVAAAMVAVD